MNDDRKKFDAAVALLTSRVSSGRCIRDPLADLHEALVPFHGKASGNPAALSEKPAESGLWRPVAGKYGRMRNGRKAGPLRWSPKLLKFAGAIDGELHLWRDPLDAKDFLPHPLDLVSEWIEPAEEPPLVIREGAWYMRRDGKVKGPAEASLRGIGSPYPWDIGGMTYTNDGSHYIGAETKLDLIREVPAPEASE